LFHWHSGEVLVITEDGPGKGKTIVDEGKKTWIGHNEWQGRPKIRVALSAEYDKIVSWVLNKMKGS
jgi:inosine-uridine nucleoside N-ribohydrolase